MIDLVVTQHPALVALLQERGLIGDTPRVIAHATADDVRDQHVIGILPLQLAAAAETVTTIPLALEPQDRGKELSLDRIREIAGEARTYCVTDIS